MPSFDILKDHIISLLRSKIKSILSIHDPLGIRFIPQLRVSLSPLRSHKRRDNFIDTPRDTCHCNQPLIITMLNTYMIYLLFLYVWTVVLAEFLCHATIYVVLEKRIHKKIKGKTSLGCEARTSC